MKIWLGSFVILGWLGVQASPLFEQVSGGENSFADPSNLSQWLGPLAPIALSPFFGLTLLSGGNIWTGLAAGE